MSTRRERRKGYPLLDFPEDLGSRLGDRIADREAPRLAEMATFAHRWGQDFAAGVTGIPKRSGTE
jgi:hypothetical protein